MVHGLGHSRCCCVRRRASREAAVARWTRLVRRLRRIRRLQRIFGHLGQFLQLHISEDIRTRLRRAFPTKAAEKKL